MEEMKVDLQAYAQSLERQRNGALNESAMLAAALDTSRAEVAALKTELETMRAKSKIPREAECPDS